MTTTPLVDIHYLRPPNRKEIFTQFLVLDTPDVKVTLAREVPFHPPIRILGQVALEKGSDAVWFTFPGRWHDIGRFHLADGTFTGIYANILTPVAIRSRDTWETTDLFLDIWIPAEGSLVVLDEEQLEGALEREWVKPALARRAREEVAWIQKEHGAGRWPPPMVAEWTRERAREAVTS